MRQQHIARWLHHPCIDKTSHIWSPWGAGSQVSQGQRTADVLTEGGRMQKAAWIKIWHKKTTTKQQPENTHWKEDHFFLGGFPQCPLDNKLSRSDLNLDFDQYALYLYALVCVCACKYIEKLWFFFFLTDKSTQYTNQFVATSLTLKWVLWVSIWFLRIYMPLRQTSNWEIFFHVQNLSKRPGKNVLQLRWKHTQKQKM